MLSERKGGNLKSRVVFFYNRHLCSVIVEFYIQEIPQIQEKKLKKKISYSEASLVCLKVTPVCSMSASVI